MFTIQTKFYLKKFDIETKIGTHVSVTNIHTKRVNENSCTKLYTNKIYEYSIVGGVAQLTNSRCGVVEPNSICLYAS